MANPVVALPQFASDLIAELDRLYPVRTIKPGDSIELIMYQAGQRSVVTSLLARLQHSNRKEDMPIVR